MTLTTNGCLGLASISQAGFSHQVLRGSRLLIHDTCRSLTWVRRLYGKAACMEYGRDVADSAAKLALLSLIFHTRSICSEQIERVCVNVSSHNGSHDHKLCCRQSYLPRTAIPREVD